MRTKDIPLNMPCSDPEGCKHFKAEMKLREQFKALEEENERLKAKNEESKESISQCHQAYHKTSVYYRNRIAELETTIKNACDLINNEGKVNKWNILNILNQPKGK